MARESEHVEIGHIPELLRLAEEVRASKEPRVLTRDREAIAVLTPARPRRGRRPKTQADYEAFLSSLGSWRDVDTEALKRDIREARGSNRAPVDL
jgi:hypothetical protein